MKFTMIQMISQNTTMYIFRRKCILNTLFHALNGIFNKRYPGNTEETIKKGQSRETGNIG